MRSFLDFLDMNRRLVIAVLIGSVCLLGMQFFVSNAAKECIGIADTKETIVSFEVPVLVKRVYVLPGQTVKKGQPLLEVEVPEIKLKLLEVQTMLESLESEQNVRNVLLGSFGSGKEAKNGKVGSNSPIAQEIAGLRRQVAELKNQEAQAVRYAEADGVVATVAFSAREKVAPFAPIITLTPFVPNFAYGFINEKVTSEMKVGEKVIIEPINDRTRFATGRVISIGARITAFTDRLQMVNTSQSSGRGGNGFGGGSTPMYFGRELVVSIDPKNSIVIGEKVHIRTQEQSRFPELGFQAFADDVNLGAPTTSELLSAAMQMEAGGLALADGQGTMISVSDEVGPNGSPFWMLTGEKFDTYTNLPMRGLKKIDDVESISLSGGFYYALGSQSRNKSGEIKRPRNLIARFTIDPQGAAVDRHFELREPLIAALQNIPILQNIHPRLDLIEIEGFTVNGGDAFVALKEPQMPDGSTVILKLPGFIRQLDENNVTSVLAEIYAVVRLDSQCDAAARVSDLMKTPTGMLVLGNCKRNESMGEVFWLADFDPSHHLSTIATLRGGRPEGMIVGADMKTIFVVSDNGKKGSDLIRLTVPNPIQ